MATQHLLAAAAVVILVASRSLHAATTSAETAYDILEQNNLPRGLLPQGVRSYVLSPESQLEATLPGECAVFVSIAGEQYKFLYGGTVGGYLKPGSIHGVYGVRIQVGFHVEWLAINQVIRAGDQLTIQAEKLSWSLPVSAFDQSPRCSNN